ncbi:LacI family DNA-binding transcriptional regulator [Actinopolyspora saharensis]|uniref:Transcriptional regulator, LacI family n=1 Tax=Actinopolyspora saharensis TaxID=995062 RepID=A0A1H1GZ54_9ACTN|nr:LacI family DNA-binding transcriptional regulator [Actinopolyspora saharensis]SDR18373.1 transcriptional regulator, LacI family [Actinopolyspora saharensis]
MVTSRDIAQRAGVSQATVSRVLQGNSRVAPDTRERVLAAMRATDYRPHAAARAMKTRRSQTIGVVIADITNPFYPELLEAVSHALDQSGQRMILWNSAGPGEYSALQAIREGSVDGLLFTTVTEGAAPLTEALVHEEPVVLLHRGLEEAQCDQVVSDNVAGGSIVADYLVRAGHEHIGYLQGPELPSTAVHRERGFRRRLHQLGMDLRPELVGRAGFQHDTARTLIRSMLHEPVPPTAVFCANDLAAFGAIDGARSLGVHVPEDLWVVGYDDIAMAAWDSFNLTSVRQPIADLAHTAVQLLLERITDPDLPVRHELFTNSLTVRGSTAHTPLDPPAEQRDSHADD